LRNVLNNPTERCCQRQNVADWQRLFPSVLLGYYGCHPR
jgi:hypothetical protein